MSKAVILLSGGLDSATVLAVARSSGATCYCLSVQYGQRHAHELAAARAVAASQGVSRHLVIPIDLRQIGGSALTDSIEVPKNRTGEELSSGIPVTYVPARNTILLSLALGWAEVVGAFDIYIGANCIDYSGYPDCRGEYLEAFETMANLATKAAVEGSGRFRIIAPLLELTKKQIIERGSQLGVDYGLTLSCYDPSETGLACGLCDSCQLRRDGFREAGLPDPTSYA